MSLTKVQLGNGLERLLAYAAIGYFLVYYFHPQLERDRNFFYILVLPLAALYGLVNIRKLPISNHLLVLSLITITYLSAAVLWGPEPGATEYWKLAKRGLYLGCYFIALWALLNTFQYSLVRLIQYFVAATALSACISLAYYFYSTGLTLPRMAPALIPQPLFGAVAYGIGLVCALYLFCTASHLQQAARQLFFIVPLALAMALTHSRGPVLAAIVAAIVIGVSPRTNRTRWATLLLVFLCLGIVAFLATPLGELFLQRGVSYRTDIWSATLATMDGHWLFGHGWWQEPLVQTPVGTFANAHSVYLGTLRHSGIVGCIFLAIVIAAHLRQGAKAKNSAIEIMTIWLVFALGYMVADNYYPITRPGIIWIVFWTPIIVICHNSVSRTAEINHIIGLPNESNPR